MLIKAVVIHETFKNNVIITCNQSNRKIANLSIVMLRNNLTLICGKKIMEIGKTTKNNYSAL